MACAYNPSSSSNIADFLYMYVVCLQGKEIIVYYIAKKPAMTSLKTNIG